MAQTWTRIRSWLDNFFDTGPRDEPEERAGNSGGPDGGEPEGSTAPATEANVELFLSGLFAKLRLRKRPQVLQAFRPQAAVGTFFSMFAMLFVFVATLSAQAPLRTFLIEVSPEATEAVVGLVPDFLILIFGVGSAMTAYRLGAHWRGRSLRFFLRSAVQSGLLPPEAVESYLRERFEVEWKP